MALVFLEMIFKLSSASAGGKEGTSPGVLCFAEQRYPAQVISGKRSIQVKDLLPDLFLHKEFCKQPNISIKNIFFSESHGHSASIFAGALGAA